MPVIAKASDKKLSEDQRSAVLRQILDNAVVAQGVDDIFMLADHASQAPTSA